ncbi:MAG: ribosome small subunit-dependent GTPase A [Acidobacteriia bacterium]|nr:ribosome small subunit-dependent GTPase A [Terriglobia bacterium]
MELYSYGWDAQWARALASTGAGLIAGRVVMATHGLCRLWTVDGLREATLSGALIQSPASERPVTGDWVALEAATGRVRAVLPRRKTLSRKKAGREYEEQLIAANVDVLLVVMGLDGDFHPRRLERYLLLGEESRAEVVVVLNKSDVCADALEKVRKVDRLTCAAVVLMSAMEAESVRQLHRYVEAGQTAALVGSSGVGKSTIVNALLGAGCQETSAVRAGDSRGRHTTTARELFLLEEGWLLLDMPGMRELEVWTGPEAVRASFGDIDELSKECRFRDCRHAGEPGCAVAQAVQDGVVETGRLANFHKLHRETDAQKIKRAHRIAQRAYNKMKR